MREGLWHGGGVVMTRGKSCHDMMEGLSWHDGRIVLYTNKEHMSRCSKGNMSQIPTHRASLHTKGSAWLLQEG